MSRELRFGVLGAGQISRVACREINGHAAGRVVAASDPHPERLSELSAELGGLRTYPENEALLADPDVDAVFIATPNAFHAPLARAALAAGKHVLLEKPFATSAAEAETVVAAAKGTGKLLSIGMNERFRPASQRVAALARAGELGHVYHAKAFWFRRAGIPKLGTWFGKKSLAGGGALYDIGVHLLDLALFLMDRFDPVSVSGQTYSTFGPRGIGEGGWGLSERGHADFDVEDGATALLRFAGGATLTLDVSWAIHQKEPDSRNVILHGSEAGAACYPGEHYRFGAEKGSYASGGLAETPLEYPHMCRFHNFIGAVLGSESLCVTPEQALSVQRVLDAIYESSRLGREVMLSQP
ncbi:MAG TPA: Gfo/Idh/MocA family oxidoreductase [Polyangiaceae bacterium]|nr:Gfo/Idh/MocA family oxidoreductase [Polyangiaceae bacterium]